MLDIVRAIAQQRAAKLWHKKHADLSREERGRVCQRTFNSILAELRKGAHMSDIDVVTYLDAALDEERRACPPGISSGELSGGLNASATVGS